MNLRLILTSALSLTLFASAGSAQLTQLNSESLDTIERASGSELQGFGDGLADALSLSARSTSWNKSSFSAAVCLEDTMRYAEDERSKGYFGGLGFSAVTLMHFSGDVQNPDEVESGDIIWGGPDSLGLFTDNITNSWRLEFNPFEYRQKILGEFLGITTGVGFDWWRIAVENNHELSFDENTDQVVANILPEDSLDVQKHRLDAIYLRVPVLVSFRTSKKPDEGLHIEAGVVGGYRLVGQYFREFRQFTQVTTNTDKSFPFNGFSVNARFAFGYGNVSVVGEAGLIPTFAETRAPALHSGSVGIHFAFN